MPRYAITQRAGPFVAAHRSTGIGTVPELTARQAEHELRLVTLVAPAPTPLASSPTPPKTSIVALTINHARQPAIRLRRAAACSEDGESGPQLLTCRHGRL